MEKPANTQDEMAACLAGEKLYGDDFTGEQLRQWYQDELEGYANLGAEDGGPYVYSRHRRDWWHGFRHLPERRWSHVLGLGSARGEEFAPVIEKIDRLTIVEPSAQLARTEIHGLPATYVQPDVSGTLPFADGTFDLAVCFSVLHHIPNVSHVVAEVYRCLKTGGFALVQEPIVSMGDWRQPRPGLTKHERGIPLALFVDLIHRAGFKIQRQAVWNHPLVRRYWESVARRDAYDSLFGVWVDSALSRLMGFRLRYHRTTLFQRLKPSCVFFVLSK